MDLRRSLCVHLISDKMNFKIKQLRTKKIRTLYTHQRKNPRKRTVKFLTSKKQTQGHLSSKKKHHNLEKKKKRLSRIE